MGATVAAARALKAGRFDFMDGAPSSAEIAALLPKS
jgi:hypothetical protein